MCDQALRTALMPAQMERQVDVTAAITCPLQMAKKHGALILNSRKWC